MDNTSEPRIENLREKKLIGKRMKMCLAENKTYELWHSFMPKRKEIKNVSGTNLYSVQVYDPSMSFQLFDQNTVFEKWAAAEVTSFDSLPTDMETLILPSGLYVVFIYKGLPANFAGMFQYIFGTWLPASGYTLDKRPHFEILGEKYKNNDPDSEEEVWVPVKKKGIRISDVTLLKEVKHITTPYQS